MKRITPIIQRIYALLLRLYPPHFRATFADEMQSVFVQAVQEIQTRPALFGLVLRELSTLPINVVREHLHERRRKAFLSTGEVSMTMPYLFRWTTTSLLVCFTVFVVLVVLPFFAMGIHMQPPNQVMGSMFDPKGFPLYSHTDLLLVLTYLVMIGAPLCGLALSFVPGMTLLRQWGNLQMMQRLVGGGAILAGAALLLFPISPLGRLIYIWLLD